MITGGFALPIRHVNLIIIDIPLHVFQKGHVISRDGERTFVMIKPDGVQRGSVGDILQRFERKGFKLVAMKFVYPPADIWDEHYSDHVGKPFFPSLKTFMTSGPVCVTIWQGAHAVDTCRNMVGDTDPWDASPGSIRGDFCVNIGRNVCMASENPEKAAKQMDLWFTKEDLINYELCTKNVLYGEEYE